MLENNANDLAGFVNGYLAVGEFDESGIGNLHLGTKFALTPLDSANRVALSLFYDMPTGDDVVTSGEGDYGVGLHWTRGIGTLGATYKITGEPDDDDFEQAFVTDVANELHVDGGLNVPLSFWETTNWVNEVNGIFFQGADREPDDIVYLMTGLRHWFGTSGWSLSAGIRLNATMLGSDNNSCPWGGVLGLGFAPMHLTPRRGSPASASASASARGTAASAGHASASAGGAAAAAPGHPHRRDPLRSRIGAPDQYRQGDPRRRRSPHEAGAARQRDRHRLHR